MTPTLLNSSIQCLLISCQIWAKLSAWVQSIAGTEPPPRGQYLDMSDLMKPYLRATEIQGEKFSISGRLMTCNIFMQGATPQVWPSKMGYRQRRFPAKNSSSLVTLESNASSPSPQPSPLRPIWPSHRYLSPGMATAPSSLALSTLPLQIPLLYLNSIVQNHVTHTPASQASHCPQNKSHSTYHSLQGSSMIWSLPSPPTLSAMQSRSVHIEMPRVPCIHHAVSHPHASMYSITSSQKVLHLIPNRIPH